MITVDVQGIVKHVRADEFAPYDSTMSALEYWTELGWKLVAMGSIAQTVRDEYTVQCQGGVECTHGMNQQNYCGQSRSTHYSNPQEIPLFVLTKGIDDRLGELSKEMGEWKTCSELAYKSRDTAQYELKVAEEKITELVDQLNKGDENIKHWRGASLKQEERNRKMEEDIAKLRQQFGEKAIKEALDA